MRPSVDEAVRRMQRRGGSAGKLWWARCLWPVVVAALLAPASAWAIPAAHGTHVSSVFSPASTPAADIRQLSYLAIGICAFVFAVVFTLIVYCIVRFRRRDPSDQQEPPQIYGSYPIELAWTVVPLLLVTVLFLATTRTLGDLELKQPQKNAVKVTVVGHQWWWEFRYPGLGVVTANELHVPVGSPGHPVPTFLTLESADVIHSFWVPRLAGKTDLIPNRENHMWIEPTKPGTYFGQCAEFCGAQHANMLIRVIAEPVAQFDRWVAEQQRLAAAPTFGSAGQKLFFSTACVNCHSIRGTPAHGTFGPDLTHLMSRETLGAGVVANTAKELRAWVLDPQKLKPGCRMPSMQLTRPEADEIVAYLQTLK